MRSVPAAVLVDAPFEQAHLRGQRVDVALHPVDLLLELVKTLTTLGRPGVQVAAITRRADGYYIIHVESGKEGDYPLVNGTPIGPQARKLHDNDVMQLAGVKMGFFES